jgi:hypothetical protein
MSLCNRATIFGFQSLFLFSVPQYFGACAFVRNSVHLVGHNIGPLGNTRKLHFTSIVSRGVNSGEGVCPVDIPLETMKVSELRVLGSDLGLGSMADCFDKKDMIEKVIFDGNFRCRL